VAWELSGKVAVVTGASSGIGRATAQRLAQEGMTVVAVARREERLQELADEFDGIVPHVADVTSTDEVDELADRVRQDFGVCHALINNAGVGGGAFENRKDLDDALHTIDVNLQGVFRCAAAFAELLEDSAPSRVINVASVAGKIGIGPPAYAASKFGAVGLSEALGFAWKSRGITVCQLNPGFIETEGFPQEQVKGGPFEPLLGEPEDVADAVVDALRNGKVERTVPRTYRLFILIRHLVAPLFRAIAGRTARAKGSRD
jgi:NAD(P)-dependent dehydrogenase (short-subunit alcohol dehydrogenase family)